MMMMMGRVMCVLAVVLCCACGATLSVGVAATSNDVWNDFLGTAIYDYDCFKRNAEKSINGITCEAWKKHKKETGEPDPYAPASSPPQPLQNTVNHPVLTEAVQRQEITGETSSQGAELGQESKGTKGDTPEHPVSATEAEGQKQETDATDGAITSRGQTPDSNAAQQVNQETSSTTANSTLGNSKPYQQSPATVDATDTPNSQQTNSTTPPSPESTTTEAPTTIPSLSSVPSAEISSITSTMKNNKANVDNSVNPVWMRTAAPLLIVAVLFSVTVY
ncbi:uncharacterized protein TM35_000601380 [Trypanosoma theileri]|uniref:Mucin-associated surface protein (MASP) n=1 Tax=Trypanosoma theileri TaxID=67003 RepID=A0A1X0NGB0_9TRYP|nr:uncharacterized protein TM35_000601380 [Trypanosoma theileri]ORC83707.1 hypothetical protein TM35_000601380 [Trypanosoma theileri]